MHPLLAHHLDGFVRATPRKSWTVTVDSHELRVTKTNTSVTNGVPSRYNE